MPQEVKISNEAAEAVISAQAAEVISFRALNNGVETIWNRDPEFWSNCTPILFPYTGALINGQYEINGQTYTLGQHGFARHAEFEFEEIKHDCCKLHLRHNDYSLSVYPFKFDLSVRYSLNGPRLNIDCWVQNLDDAELPFNIGFHPAFNAPLTRGLSYDDCIIELEQTEDLTSDKVQIGKVSSFRLKQHLPEGSWFFHNGHIRSKWAQLTDGIHTIRVGCEDYLTLGFWRKTTETPFMCIEPWFPKCDLKKAETFRAGTPNNLLAPGQMFHCAYYFEIIK